MEESITQETDGINKEGKRKTEREGGRALKHQMRGKSPKLFVKGNK